jgi:hypothetical protein
MCEHVGEKSGSGLLLYSRIISQGAYISGEIKEESSEVTGKPIHPQPQGQGCGVKAPRVTDVMPEAGRSRPGQGEVRGNPHGGPRSF